MKEFDVYGYYSSADFGYPEYLETFETQQEADEFVKDFERIPSRNAWIETRNIPIKQ